MSEKRISDEELQDILVDPCITDLKIRNLVRDLLEARRPLAAKAQGGAEFGSREAHRIVEQVFPGDSQIAHAQRWAFIIGVLHASQQPAPSAPTPEPAPAVPTPAQEIKFVGPSEAVSKANKESLDRFSQGLADCQAIIGSTIVPLDLGPSYLERLRDSFAVAHAASGSLPADAYRWADQCIKQRDTNGAAK